MSGGSLDYIQYKIDETAREILRRSVDRPDAVLLRAFANHLLTVGKLCHTIEWDFSGDSSLNDDDRKAIKAAIGGQAVLKQALDEAIQAHKNLGLAITEAI
jgi:hypothetical protein